MGSSLIGSVNPNKEKTMSVHMKHYGTDEGYCRVYYTYNDRIFCLQQKGHYDFEFFGTTEDWGEPDFPVDFLSFTFEEPPGIVSTERLLIQWLREKKLTTSSVQQNVG